MWDWLPSPASPLILSIASNKGQVLAVPAWRKTWRCLLQAQPLPVLPRRPIRSMVPPSGYWLGFMSCPNFLVCCDRKPSDIPRSWWAIPKFLVAVISFWDEEGLTNIHDFPFAAVQLGLLTYWVAAIISSISEWGKYTRSKYGNKPVVKVDLRCKWI